MDPMRRTVVLLACAGALAATLSVALTLAPESVGSGLAAAEAAARDGSRSGPAPAAAAGDASAASAGARRFHAGYRRWRKRLQRHGLYVGRDLLPRVRAADGGARAPTRRELRRSIHRMQKRWGRWLRTTPRGRAVRFKLRVRRGVPRWGKQYLRSIAWCESRNDPRAVGGGGAYRGLYQFSVRTWYVVGGTGDPAAAPRHEQTWRAWLLLSRHGSGHWPVCG
jgi:hypothetical protein